jgi:hypothetical protein
MSRRQASRKELLATNHPIGAPGQLAEEAELLDRELRAWPQARAMWSAGEIWSGPTSISRFSGGRTEASAATR